MINLGFLHRPQDRVQRRRVDSLIFPAYNRLTGAQAILGRRNDNSWIKRSDNPVDASSSDLITYTFVRQNSFVSVGSNFNHHILWAYPDWSPGESGKSGLGHNLQESRDDCATWAAITGFSDVVDYGPFNNISYVLHDGGDQLSYRPSGVFGDQSTGHDFALTHTMNRVMAVANLSLGGGTTRSHVILGAADGVYAFVYDATTISGVTTFAFVSLDGPTAWPTADPLPWSQKFFVVGSGALANVYLVMQPTYQGGAYSIPFGGLVPAGGSWTLDMSAATTPPLQTATFMASGGTRSSRFFNWNASSIWLEIDMSPNPTAPSGQRGAFDGAEAVFGGVFPVVQSGIAPAPEALITIDPSSPHVILASESVRTAYLFLGEVPGEGSNPSYTHQQLASVVRRASTTLEFNDESALLIVGGVQYTLQTLYSGGSVNPTVLDPSWRNTIG